METGGLFGKTISILSRALDLRARNHNLIASNIANMDTPGYKAFEMHVEEALQKTAGTGKGLKKMPLALTRGSHMPGRYQRTDEVRVVESETSKFSLRGDGNTVDIDRSMVNLAENNLLYNTAAQLIGKKFQGLKNVIQGGKQ